MTTQIIDLFSSDSFACTVKYLMQEKVGAIHCDTVYGLCARANSTNAEKIYKIKNRPENKSFITLTNFNCLKESSLIIPDVLYDHWPCSLTAILSDKEGVTHAVRVPNDDFVISLIDKVGPIFSTSANLSGEPILNTVEDIYNVFNNKIDFIIDKKITNADFIPSTLVDFTSKPYRVLRPGSYDVSSII